MFTNANGVHLGDPALEPIFDELERRKAVVYVHPNPSPDGAAHSLGLPDNLLDFPADTNRAVAQLHYTNRFARTPSVTYIFSHAGGSIPYLAARFAIIDDMGFVGDAERRGSAADMFRRVYWDTAPSASDPVLRMLRDVAGISQVLYGTDFPYLRRDLTIKSREHILRSPALTDAERRAILGDNASRLFPRFRARTGSRRTPCEHVAISPAEAADRLAIRELVEAYAHFADRRNAVAQMSLFRTDAHFVVSMNATDPTADAGVPLPGRARARVRGADPVRRHDALPRTDHDCHAWRRARHGTPPWIFIS